MICLSSDIPHFDQFFAHQSPDVINGAILYFEQGDPFLLTCIKETHEIQGNAAWGEIGPRLITRVLRQQQRFDYARSSSSCYPIHHKEALDLLNPDFTDDLRNRIKSSLFLHLWNEVLRRNNVAKDFLPPRGSLLRELADRHRVAGWQDNLSGIRKIIRFWNFERTKARVERAVLAKAQRQLSSNFAERGLQEQALTAARRAVDFDPHDGGIQYHLGDSLQNCGSLAEAEAAYSRAIELQPDLAWAHGRLSAIFAERGLQEQALTAARRAIECKPDDTWFHYNLGNLLQQQDKLDEAVAAYQRAFELKPDNAKAQQKLDEIYASESFHEDALAGSQRAVDCDPG